MRIVFGLMAIGSMLCAILFFKMHKKLTSQIPFPIAFNWLGYLIILMLGILFGFATIKCLF
jgi:hypothetical protein